MIRGRKLVAVLAACCATVAVGAGSAPAAEHAHNAADLAACNWATPDGARGIGGFGASGFSSTSRGGRQREPVMSTDAEIEGARRPCRRASRRPCRSTCT